ncbi:hypothetical protein [Piscirickettsia litoralis]|uniref:Uncharacterized protein n=1 Tax=Piscirickettsia litoralis TaxID=1891921 RepID=A0ABX3A3D1_9GAMM|nr:hypothetical protein [Piscirickettsia litoralis]ODN42948.1 hypothetical protein BGC07_08470 [Piscirickettsia litoralis]
MAGSNSPKTIIDTYLLPNDPEARVNSTGVERCIGQMAAKVANSGQFARPTVMKHLFQAAHDEKETGSGQDMDNGLDL